MLLFVEFDENQNITRVVVESRESGEPVQYVHAVVDGEGNVVPATPPASLVNTVSWAVQRITEAKNRRLDDVLKNLGGVADEDVAEVRAAIEAVKTRTR